jgi:N-acetylmuramoyl-L-alanine amidase
MTTIYKMGSRGDGVKMLQQALCRAGYPMICDGIYGVITRDAVVEFQRKHHLVSDGIVGPATIALLLPTVFRLKKSKRTIREIIIHCSATPEGKDYTVEDIRRWHKAKGWSDIGYHYVTYRNGNIDNGRDGDLLGAHCSSGGHNTHSIGICYIGGMDKENKHSKDTRTLAQKAAFLSLLIDLRQLYPGVKIYGHHDFDNRKDCPCFDVMAEYEK